MQNINTKFNYFKITELNNDVAMISTKVPCVNESNILLLIDSLELIKDLYKEIIIDISTIDNIDRFSTTYLSKNISKLQSSGVIIKLIVSKDKPVISFSKGDQFSDFNIYLSLDESLKYQVN